MLTTLPGPMVRTEARAVLGTALAGAADRPSTLA